MPDRDQRGPSGVFVGLSTIDVIYRVSSLPALNSKQVATSQDVSAGGPATNAAITFACLGGSASLVTALGTHPLSALARAELERFEVSHIDLSPGFTGVPAISSIFVDGSGMRSIVSANATRLPLELRSVPASVLDDAKILLVDGHHMEACVVWAKAARERGIPVVFDGGSWKEGTDALLACVDIAVCSADFRAPGDGLIEYLRSSGVSRIAITRGAEPVLVFDHAQQSEIAVPVVDVIDTTGAGDIFHGAFCYAYASGSGMEQAVEYAAGIASASCGYEGARAWSK